MYKTIGTDGTFEQTINKSTFLGYCFKVENELQAQEKITELKKKFPDARHCCWAYVLGEDRTQMRYSDDGEPQGTAGIPMLEVINKKGLTNVIVLVVRYFGGILLGAGGLARAYSSTCVGAIDNSTVVQMISCTRFTVTVDYTLHSKMLKPLAKQKVIAENTEYGEMVTLTLLTPEEEYGRMTEFLTEITNGNADINEKEKIFYPWQEI